MASDPPADARPPQGVVMQMLMGAWAAQTVATVTRLDIPDLLHCRRHVRRRPRWRYLPAARHRPRLGRRTRRAGAAELPRPVAGAGPRPCVDNVLPPMGDTGCSGTKLLDMLMLASLPGHERTEAEWRALYAAAGLTLASITLLNPRSGESLIEGVADPSR
jgi:hypothetical protein